MVTEEMRGAFETDDRVRAEFLNAIGKSAA
jgi:GTP cyclohydrolase I